MPSHASLTGADLHESKGAAAATAGQIAVADGAGAAPFTSTLSNYTLTSAQKNLNKVTLNVSFADISTPGSEWVVAPIAGIITLFKTVIQNAITVADCNIKLKIATIDVTNGAIIVANAGSAAGDVDSASPTAARTVTAGQAIEIVSDGASTTTCKATVTLIIDVS